MRRLSAPKSFGISSNASGILLSSLSLRFLSYHHDYFSLLGVNRDVKVDIDVLKKNYHAFQSEHHPDLHHQSPASSDASPSASPTPNLKDATAYASNAYSVLKDPFLRCRYLRLLLEADAKAILSQDKALLPSGEDYYCLAVSHDASEGKEAAAKHHSEGSDSASSICEAVRSDDKKANPVNHDQTFLMEMMELNMRLAEALELDSEDPARKKELDALKAEVIQLEEHYFGACESLYGRVLTLREELLGENTAAAASAGSSAKDVFAMAKNQFRDTVLKWTFASNLRRQINEAY